LRARLVRIRQNRQTPLLLPSTSAVPQLQARPSTLLPAAARKAFGALFQVQELRVEVRLPERKRAHPMLAAGAPEVQRRRKRWKDNVARYALPAGASVDVTVIGSTWRKDPPAGSGRVAA